MSEKAQLSVALLGAGSMGQHHARVVSASANSRLAVVIDSDVTRATTLADAHGVLASDDIEQATQCDAAIVAIPTERHREVAEPLLRVGVPLLVEKPLASQMTDVTSLIETASAVGVPMMCGFVERFNPVVLTAQRAVGDGAVRHIVGIRHSPPAPRIRVNVVQDMLIHDLDLACRFATGPYTGVSAQGWWPAGTAMLEIADAVVRFEGSVAHLSADRWSQHKIRTLSVTTDDALYEMDLLRQTLTVYRHRGQALALDGSYRSETAIEIPFIRQAGEPLALQWQRFVDLVTDRADWRTELDGYEPPHRLAARVLELASGRVDGRS